MKWGATSRGWEADLGRVGWLEVVSVGPQWMALWSNYGVETPLGVHDTDMLARQAAQEWVDVVRAELGNVAAAGYAEPVDDGN